VCVCVAIYVYLEGGLSKMWSNTVSVWRTHTLRKSVWHTLCAVVWPLSIGGFGIMIFFLGSIQVCVCVSVRECV